MGITNLILFSLMCISFYGYCIFVGVKYGVQSSISQSWYVAPKWLHSIAVLGYLIPGLLLGNSLWAFFTACALAVVYVTPDFRSTSMESIGHALSAPLAMILTQCLVIYMGYINISYITLAVLLAIEYIPQDIPNVQIYNKTWWIENVIFTSYVIAIALHTHIF